ncbi:MAG TPA: hypothetical protein VJ777_05155 [Mycobacterium sp.]|nr:hypothetical protein [Mycobacterium sp.]
MISRDHRRHPDESSDTAPQLSAAEVAAMNKLEAAWRDFGGPSAGDIFVEFGISVEEFYRRLYGRRSRVRPDTAAAHTPQRRIGARPDRANNRPPGPARHGEGSTP